MNIFTKYILSLLTILPLLACQSTNTTKSNTKLDNKSFIKNFELVQENNSNDTRIRITSPKAIIDPKSNDIEIFESSIEILNKNKVEIKVSSGNSTLNNLSNTIRVFNNANISFLNNEDYFIRTNSFNWDLNTYIIDIENPLNINFNNTNIIASNGFFNIDLNLLKIYNSRFNRSVFNSDGKEQYQIKINSDFAKWLKNENTLFFLSNEKQVETTIKFLNIK